MTTTLEIQGKTVKEYKGIVFGEVIMGTNVVKDFKAAFTNFFGGRSKSYETDLLKARDEALKEMEERAGALGADAVIGVNIQYAGISQGNDAMLMVTTSGTAVKLEY
jgi:uncharacterized protein YbjQ (UPF0145 family)